MKPRLLDLFCGAGGAAMGYHRAGFDVVGVDHNPQPRYPFAFVLADALEYCREHGREYDVIHGSPPCQGYTGMNRRHPETRAKHPLFLDSLRLVFKENGKPSVIENVEAAPMKGIRLCGSSFGLDTHRHRLFESSELLFSAPCRHAGSRNIPVLGKLDGRRLWTRQDGSELRAARTLDEAQQAMGIDWMTWDELREAIPPAYTEWIGRQLLRVLNAL